MFDLLHEHRFLQVATEMIHCYAECAVIHNTVDYFLTIPFHREYFQFFDGLGMRIVVNFTPMSVKVSQFSSAETHQRKIEIE